MTPQVVTVNVARFFDLSDLLLGVASDEGRWLRVNPAGRRLLGYTEDELYERTLADLVHPEDAHLMAACRNRLAAGEVVTFESRCCCRDGSCRWFVWKIIPSLEEKAWYVIGEDRSEVARWREIADARARELQQFAYVASHDLKEPLRMVSSYVQLLARRYRGKLDADADEFIAFAVDGANRMQSMITDLLSYSRVTTQGKPFEPTDMNAVFDRATANLQLAIEEFGAVVTRDDLPTICADGAQMVQLLQHLVGNAIKFRRSDERPEIHVAARQQGGEWIFSVSDNGMGIEPKDHERVFHIFQKLHGRGEYPGNGIGLAICRKIVERHGGRIWVESDLGRGSTFYFTLPADKEG